MDGLTLTNLALATTAPQPLTRTLLYPDWQAWLPTRSRIFVVEQRAWRPAWDGKGLAVCDVHAGTCHALTQQPGTVTFSPTASPDGKQIAFVQAKDAGDVGGFGSNQAVAAWDQTRTLWLADAAGTGMHELTTAGTGIDRPQWSHDGSHVLYVRDTALWLVGADGNAPTRIVGPLANAPDTFSIYGHVPWDDYVAWYR